MVAGKSVATLPLSSGSTLKNPSLGRFEVAVDLPLQVFKFPHCNWQLLCSNNSGKRRAWAWRK